ncbi:MAG: ABC transporter ATP-binding protein [Chitinophagaceae bacterium]
MEIILQSAGKRFNRNWIFRNLNYHFHSSKKYAIIGPNGSGKSTLLQILAGSMNLSEGSVSYQKSKIENQKLEIGNRKSEIQSENIYKHISLTAPYLEVIEEMTAIEFLQFHASFKSFISSVNINKIIEIIGLKNSAHQQIRFYSSGMKQRVKIAQAIFSDVLVLLLDEPCTNLDEAGYNLYYDLINTYCKNKLIIVSSNDVNEYNFCEEKLNITDYK